MIPLAGRAAVLTGAAEGLGNAVARELAAAGMRLALIDVQGDKLHGLADELARGGCDVLAIVADLANAGETQGAIAAALDRFGTPRALIHNAAVLREMEMADVAFADWRREVDIILQAAFILSKAVWPGMLAARSGSILFVSSGSAVQGYPKEAAYTPGKHGQEGLMRVLAIEGQPFNVAVNTIRPGIDIDTPMSASHYTDERRARMVPPRELGPAFAFLAGIDAAFATGERFDAHQLSTAIRFGRGAAG